jgi:sec-independent protein translocase protein TatA
MTDMNAILALLDLGPTEMLVILVVALLIWGKRLPEVARNMGKSVSEFKKGIKEAEKAGYEATAEIRRAGDEASHEIQKAGDEAISDPVIPPTSQTIDGPPNGKPQALTSPADR